MKTIWVLSRYSSPCLACTDKEAAEKIAECTGLTIEELPLFALRDDKQEE